MFMNGQLLETWNQEYLTTLKVLRSYPGNKLAFKPHERSRSAKELAWTFVLEEKTIAGALNGYFNLQNLPPAPATMPEILNAYEKGHSDLVGRINTLSDGDFNRTVKFPVGPKQMGNIRCRDLIERMIMDNVHHRGQFSVYLRMAGGKVPSIYGPSADEPWT
jgi:uncharacterized damage-inducible protein DinB